MNVPSMKQPLTVPKMNGSSIELPTITKKRIPARIGKWVPKNWTSIHEEIVALKITGFSNAVLAKRFDKSLVYISKVLNTPQAKIIKRKALNDLSHNYKEFQKERLQRTQARAMERISDMIDNDQLAEDNPFAIVDRSFKLLEKTGVMASADELARGKTEVNVKGDLNINNTQVNVTQIAELKDGLKRLEEIAVIHEGVEPIDIISPSYEDN